MHQCTQCDYNSKVKCNVLRHMRSQHKIYFNKNIPVKNTQIIQEAIQIDGAPHRESLHNIQSGAGSVVTSTTHIPIEKYNEVVECAHSWKNNCEKLEEDKYVKEQTVKNRDVQLQNQNIKLQEEFVKNNNLHGEYHNALQKIQDLELLNEEICKEFDDKIGAMGKDMGKVIRKNKHLKRKNRALNNYSRWKIIHKGSGVKKKFFKTKAPTTLKVGRAGPLAPSTISVSNNGEVHYRGEKGIYFKSAEFLQRNRGIGGMLKRM